MFTTRSSTSKALSDFERIVLPGLTNFPAKVKWGAVSLADLVRLTRDLIESTCEEGASRIPDPVRDFIEEISFAEPEDILSALRDVLAEDWMAMPVWARNLAYRLACLQRPDDPELLREAAADLLSFGPDWDDFAEDLKARGVQLRN
ncbi:hypothetical protein ABZ471_25840 [Streptomyces sp. NPDC005728]|uniref:hypothetical protein n=1 Tax=Streptomyces sp. NPDC005728 TaxID=3157054 RepID=UPI0033C902FE